MSVENFSNQKPPQLLQVSFDNKKSNMTDTYFERASGLNFMSLNRSSPDRAVAAGPATLSFERVVNHDLPAEVDS